MESRDRKHLRSRGQILAAARELVLAQGADAVSLRQVAERAGYSPASLYEYFEGKDDLLATLAGEVSAKLNVRMAQVPEALPAPRRLARLGGAYLAFARENPEDYLLLFARLRSARTSGAQPPPSASPYAKVVGAAAAGIQAGTLRAADGFGAEEMAYTLWALVHGMAMLQLTHLKGYEADFEETDRRAIEKLADSFAA